MLAVLFFKSFTGVSAFRREFILFVLDGPENSIDALRLASQNGARMVEFDLRKVDSSICVMSKNLSYYFSSCLIRRHVNTYRYGFSYTFTGPKP
jgi:hypothetical protein